MDNTPSPILPKEHKGPRMGQLVGWDGKTTVDVALTQDDQNIIVSGSQDSVLIPVPDLHIHPDESGYVAAKVAAKTLSELAASGRLSGCERCNLLAAEVARLQSQVADLQRQLDKSEDDE